MSPNMSSVPLIIRHLDVDATLVYYNASVFYIMIVKYTCGVVYIA